VTLTKDHCIQLKDGAFDSTSKDDLDHLFKYLVSGVFEEVADTPY